MTPIPVLLAVDHALFRRGVARLLTTEGGFDVVGEAVDGREALAMARELLPDVVLMDLSMPVMDGLAATRRIKAEMPQVRIVILSVSDGARSLFEAIDSGASGYLQKNLEPQALYGTLRGVAQGEARVSPVMAEGLLEGFARRPLRPDPPRGGGPTTSERDVLEQVAQGRSHAEIAAALAVTESTVRLMNP